MRGDRAIGRGRTRSARARGLGAFGAGLRRVAALAVCASQVAALAVCARHVAAFVVCARHVARFAASARRVAASAVFAMLAATAAAQASDPAVEARMRYLIERAACDQGHPDQDRAACLRDAAAAYAEARRGALGGGAESASDLEANALRRCDVFQGDDRHDCFDRIRGQGVFRGSVEEGGIYRETVTREIRPAGR